VTDETAPASENGSRIFIDADACPVKDEIYRVAARYALAVLVVANAPIRVPQAPGIRFVMVEAGPDAADDWIAERAGGQDIVVTADIPLAGRCLKTGAAVLGPTGKPFTADSIGLALAQRGLMEHLRETGAVTGGPKAFTAADRSRFLQALDEAVQRLRRKARPS
jgi:uncharacterized protein YaiI (UPF0178 family)